MREAPTTGRRQRSHASGLASILVLASHLGICLAADDAQECKELTDRLKTAAAHHDAAQEVPALNEIGHGCRWELTTLSRQLVAGTIADSERAPLGPARLDMLQLLFDVRWRRADGTEPSRAWRELSLGLLERKQPDEAFAVAAHITDPYDLIALQADDRYRRIARSAFVERDILRATRKELERRRQAVTDNPRKLSPVAEVGRYLLLLHSYADVLKLTDPVIAAQTAGGETRGMPAAARYDDFERELPWILDLRSRALRALGRYDEALELLRRACASKDDPVSHSLNLALFLAQLDEPRQALAAIPDLAHATSYGRAVAAYVRTIAASELEDAAGLDSALGALQTDGQQATREQALLVAGRIDAAASVLLARLADPDERTDALLELQDYVDPPAPPLVLSWRERAKSLRNRPEVRRVIAAYGRVRSYPIPTYSGF